MSDFSTVSVVVHHEEFEILDVVDGELVETVGEHELGSLVGTVTNVGHEGSTSETTSATTINTLGLSPVLLSVKSTKTREAYIHSLELISLEAGERSGSLLDNLNLTNGAHNDLQENENYAPEMHSK